MHRRHRQHHRISIHALREEGDVGRHNFIGGKPDFYPRPPRGGRLASRICSSTATVFLSTPSARRATRAMSSSSVLSPSFLSTPSARRATLQRVKPHAKQRDFYPRPPRGGRHQDQPEQDKPPQISIHALREEGDHRLRPFNALRLLFLSTPSARRATSPSESSSPRIRFLSTPSARRATRSGSLYLTASRISIHALREEGDAAWGSGFFCCRRFLSTPSARRATPAAASASMTRSFLSTPSARRATGIGAFHALYMPISIHALREEGDAA